MRSLLLALLAATGAHGQAPGAGDLEVPAPNLEALEAVVAAQLQEARTSLTRALEAPGAAAAPLYLELGRLYHAYGLLDGAEACYRNVLRLDPASFPAAYLLGRALQTQGRFAEAVPSLRAALLLGPRYLAAWIHLGDAYRSLDQLTLAQDSYQWAALLAPQDPVVLARRGEVALAAGDPAEAARLLEAALEAQPGADRLHYSLAMAYRAQGDRDRARQHLSRSGKVGVRPRDPLEDELATLVRGERVRLVSGRMAYSVGRYDQAVEQFRDALRADPESTRARVNLAASLYRIGERDEARQHLLEVLRRAPDNVTAHYDLGLFAGYESRHAEAASHLARAHQLAPEDAEILVALADAESRSDQGAAALEHYRRAAQLDPARASAWLGQAAAWMAARRYRAAVEVLTRAQQVLPTDGRIAHLLAKLLAGSPDLGARDGARAVELAKLVVHAQPAPEHLETLAMALAEVGDCEAAARRQQEAFERALAAGTPPRLDSMRVKLRHYQTARPCRPPWAAAVTPGEAPGAAPGAPVPPRAPPPPPGASPPPSSAPPAAPRPGAPRGAGPARPGPDSR